MNDEDKASEVINNSVKTGTASKSMIPLYLGVMAIIVAVGLFSMSRMNKETKENSQMTVESQAVETNPLAASSEESVVGGDAQENVLDIAIEGASFKFMPNSFSVKAGQKVRLTFNNVEGFHDLVFDNLDIKTKQIMAGSSDVVEFTAPETSGEYTFYCSVGNHRVMGMVGKMIVE